jgi:hypothetical protein
MRVPSTRSAIFTLGLGFAGLVVAIWLAVFFTDAARPLTSGEKAELLAAENYRHFSVSAPLPPSPRHWEQSFVLIEDGRRVPLARESTALLLAITRGHRAAAGVVAFGFMTAMLGWLATRRGGAPRGSSLCVALTSLALAHAWAWQLVDPAPFLVAGFAALFVGAWLDHRVGANRSWLLGAGLSGLALSAIPLLVVAALAAMIDGLLSRPGRAALPTSGDVAPSFFRRFLPALILPVCVLAFLGMINLASTGHFSVSPAAAYHEKNSIAPTWFWQPIGTPPANVDPVIERYDQQVALPAARWPTPVYQAWTARIVNGVRYGGGVAIALAAVAAALAFCPAHRLRPILLLESLVLLLSLVRYSFSPEWWCLLAPIWLWTLLESIRFWPKASSRRMVVAGVVIGLGQVVALAWAPQIKPTNAEYGFKTRSKEILDHLATKPGSHLVFTSYDLATDARLDASHTPRNWAKSPVLFTRDLDPAQNAALVAAMPERTAWQAIVYPDRIGLAVWKPQSSENSTRSAMPAAPIPDTKTTQDNAPVRTP